MRWTIAQVAGVLVARAGAGLDPVARLAGVSIDSRTIRGGELFVAIHGPSHDRAYHVAGAFERGALAAVVAAAKVGQLPDAIRTKCIVVDDTFVALKQFARVVREAWGGKIAGVTGSVGKTTTKEILAALLGARFRVLKSEGNFNNEYGLPLTLFRLAETHQAAGLEMGMSRRGQLSGLAGLWVRLLSLRKMGSACGWNWRSRDATSFPMLSRRWQRRASGASARRKRR